MAAIYTRVEELIGRTPLFEPAALERELGLKARVLVKLEFFNPAGSVKDRAALSMILDAEEKGRIRPGDTAATPASALPPWPPPAATGSSSPCRRP